MLLSFLVGSVASTVIVDSIVSGTTLGITLFCCSRHIKQPTTTKKK